MCKLTNVYSKESFTGYKVAVERDGKYYSPAMGIEYKEGEDVIIPEKQKGLSFYYQDILDPEQPYFEPKMIGRTAAFCDTVTCFDYYRRISRELAMCEDRTKICIIKITLSKELMLGLLPFIGEVVAGKHIDKIEGTCV